MATNSKAEAKNGGAIIQAASVGSQAAYERWLPAAQKLARNEIVPLRADLNLAIHNVSIGVASVSAADPKEKKALPETDFDHLEELPNIGLATLFADGLIPRDVAHGDLQTKLKRGLFLRGLLLTNAQGLAAAGLVPAADVDKIHAGKGVLDAASDCVALAALFKKYGAQIKGKHPVTKDQVEETGQLGAELLLLLKPSSAKRASNAVGGTQAAQDRDRLWTLLVQGHEELWRAGAYLFGQAQVDQKVPPLQARQGTRKGKKPPEPTPPKA